MGDEETLRTETTTGGELRATTGGELRAGSASFENFTADRWVEWINAFLNREDYSPTVEAGNEELHHVLAKVYNGLEKKTGRDRFAEGLATVFESTPLIKKNAGALYCILELLSYIKPVRAKRIIRRHLYAGTLKPMEYGLRNLHTMLLVAASKYDVDDELSEYVKLSAREEPDYGYQLVCLRALSTRGQAEFMTFFQNVFKRTKTSTEAAQLTRETMGILRKCGYSAFCNWYTSAAVNPSPDSARSFELLEPHLKKMVFNRLEVPDFKQTPEFALLKLPDANPYYTLTAAQLHAYDGWYTPRQVVAIAKLYQQVGVDAIVNALVAIWHRTLPHAPTKQSWVFITPGSLNSANLKDPQVALV